jgi:hypothetical protein
MGIVKFPITKSSTSDNDDELIDDKLFFRIITIISSCVHFSKTNDKNKIIAHCSEYIQLYTNGSLKINWIKKYIRFITDYMNENIHFNDLVYDWKQIISIYYLCNEDNVSRDILFPEQDKISHFIDTEKNDGIINNDIVDELKKLYFKVESDHKN